MLPAVGNLARKTQSWEYNNRGLPKRLGGAGVYAIDQQWDRYGQHPADKAESIAYSPLTLWGGSSDAATVGGLTVKNSEMVNVLILAVFNALNGSLGEKFAAALILSGLHSDHPYEFEDSSAAIGILARMFRTGGEWDSKVLLCARVGVTDDNNFYLPMGDGKVIYYDVFGNVIYGATMSGFGISEGGAIVASNMYSPITGQDRRADVLAVRLGYQLREQYPHGPSRDEFNTFMFSSPVIMQLEAEKAVRETSQ
jgi:hypothetical protein